MYRLLIADDGEIIVKWAVCDIFLQSGGNLELDIV